MKLDQRFVNRFKSELSRKGIYKTCEMASTKEALAHLVEAVCQLQQEGKRINFLPGWPHGIVRSEMCLIEVE